ncbi:putative DNA topoisomerase [Rosa chinensis]|uniref:Putative DNA topoisomerase n=1 Tax=Rosa chinensis TaxID=74649 RepID=A0A2P6QY53_ROSCH|nr:putative DNA topoisomerase [Rosa chinensis]
MKKIHELSLQEHTIACSQTYRLETSRDNYLDPRITVAWCLRHRISVSKIFDSRLRNKFMWTMNVESDFRY